MTGDRQWEMTSGARCPSPARTGHPYGPFAFLPGPIALSVPPTSESAPLKMWNLMGNDLSRARVLTVASFLVNFGAQIYGMITTPNMKDVADKVRPRPYLPCQE